MHTHLTPPSLQEYSAYLRDLMKKAINHPASYDAPLSGFKIVVDPGNGGGGFMAEQVFNRRCSICKAGGPAVGRPWGRRWW